MQLTGTDHNDGFQRYRPFFNAVRDNDWNAAKTFLDQHPDALRATIAFSGKNALHVAITAGHESIVEELVELMTEQDLEMKNSYGSTVLSTAIKETASVAIAKCLIGKNKKLLSISNERHDLPVIEAVRLNQQEMARYIYSVTPEEDLLSRENGTQGSNLIFRSMNSKYSGKNVT